MQHRTTPSNGLDTRFDPIVSFAHWPNAPAVLLAAGGSGDDDDDDDEDRLRARALDGDVEALLRWRQLVEPIDYDELGWGD